METIRTCKDRNVLKEYLESKEQEVVDIMMTLFDDEQILKAYVKDIEDNKEKETERKTAVRLKSNLCKWHRPATNNLTLISCVYRTGCRCI